MSAAVSTSKIPVAAHRRQSTSSNRGSPERPTPPSRKDSSPSKIPTPSTAPAKERPQSIDVEDEFKNTLQYARLVATLQQSQDQSRSKAADVTSPSRIPVAARKLSSESLDRSSGDTSPVKSRKNGLDSCIVAENNAASSSCEDSPVHRTKIPMLKNTPRGRGSSPPKQKGPIFGWSLSPERQLSPEKVLSRQHSSSTSSVSSSTATSKTAKSSDSGAEHLIPAEGDNNGDQPTSAELKLAKKKQYEAFVMTGDRMICLAKTPANSAFISKKTVSHRQSGNLQQVPFPSEEQPVDSTSVPCSPVKPDLPVTGATKMMAMMRGSTSEEELLLPSSSELLDDAAAGSVDTLLGPSSSEVVKPHQRKASLKSSLESSPGSKQRPAQQSPDFSTSSLISSEHYNGESLLDPDNLSPQSSSSPDTPEWSLMDSFHKQRNGGDSKPQAALESIASVDEKSSDAIEEINQDAAAASLQPPDEAIKSEGNRVIITIGTNLPSSSSADPQPQMASLSDRPMSETKPMNSLNSSVDSSEESDLESLQSYHPPVRTIDVPSAERLAKRLFYLDGFKRTDVSRHLGKNNEFSQVVAEEYLRYFDFGEGISLDMALRRFLQHFCLTGETQERERVLLHFSRRYLECNPDYVHDPAKQLFRSLDAVHTLTCAIMLLNTDLHGDSVGLQRKMTCNEFIENLRELNDGHNFPRDLLRTIYYSIKETPVPWASALEELGAAAAAASGAEEGQQTLADPVKQVMATFSDGASILRTEENSAMYGEERSSSSEASNLAIGKTGGGINPFINLPDQATAVDYKKGYVVRKCCVDPNGKKTKLGKRSWRMFFINLRDMVLFCFKDEKAIRTPGAFEDYSSAIRIHHALAVRASDYTKKQFVFRLHTADRAEYLFRTSDEKELLTWIDAINYVVASFSAPPLPAACSSGGRFQRPLMPSSKSSLGMNGQLLSHENQLGQLRSDFEELLRSAPHKHAKSTVWQNYREKEEFLQFEIMRYETYILTLRTKNAHET